MANNEVTTHEKKELTGSEYTRPGRTYVPAVDIYETADGLWLRADMPGVDEQAIALVHGQGEVCQEGPLGVIQLRPGPIDRELCLRHHPFAGIGNGGVMIAAYRQCAVFHHGGDAVEGP